MTNSMKKSTTLSRRVITSLGAGAIALGVFAPTASAFTIEEATAQAHNQVNEATAQAHNQVNEAVADAQSQFINKIGDGVHTVVPITEVNAHGHTIVAPIEVPGHVVDAANQVQGVNVVSDQINASITPVAPGTQKVKNNSLPAGTENVVSHGSEGVNWNIDDQSGVIVSAQDSIVEYAPAPAPAPARAAAPAKYSASVSTPTPKHNVWDSLAQCESGGNWSINNGNGYHGGLQFHPQTWNSYGGQQYAPYAYQATREQQIAVAEKVQAGQGWGAWPACTSKLGIR